MTLSSIAALFASMLVLSATPGPSDFAIVARSATTGLRQAFIMVLGIILADCLFIVLAIYSLAAVAQSLGEFFVWVQYACGCYLIWLGVGTLRSVPDVGAQAEKNAGLSSFATGFMITLSDPKAILFYMGLFPAFVDLSSLRLVDAALVLSVATIVIVVVKMTYAWLADRARQWFENPTARQWFNRLSAAVFVTAGLYLLTQ